LLRDHNISLATWIGGDPMNEEEVDKFLNRTQPPLLGVIATIDKTGYPNALPVWYRYNRGCIRIWTDMGRAWPNDIVRNPKVSFSVQETEPPFAAVLVKGTATIETSGQHHWEEVRQITARYIDEGEVDSYIESWSMLNAMCVVIPEQIRSWSRGY
tara:strand:+ start:205 stop:672 length:468 start_codon:yes stop_codon:yes gene_type:complete